MTPIPDERLKEWREYAGHPLSDAIEGFTMPCCGAWYSCQQEALARTHNCARYTDTLRAGMRELLDEIEALRKALLLISKQPICSMAMSGAVRIARAALSPPPPPSRSAPDTETEP